MQDFDLRVHLKSRVLILVPRVLILAYTSVLHVIFVGFLVQGL